LKSLWQAIKWGTLITVTLLAVASVYLYRNIDSQLKIFVRSKLAQQLPSFVTELESAQLIPSKGIIVRGITISLPVKFGKPEQILTIQEAFIACDVELQSILSGNTKPTAIKLQKLTLHLTCDENGKLFGWEQLQSLKPSGESCPIEICDGEVIYRDLRKPNVEPILLSGLNCLLTPPDQNGINWDVSGSMVNQRVGKIECQAKFSPQTQQLTLSGNAKKFNIDQELLFLLPDFHKTPIFQKSLESIQAKLNFQFEAEYDTLKNEHLPYATTFHVHGSLHEGRVNSLPIVKYPISDIQFGFDITHDSLQIIDMTATSGEASLKLGWQQNGLSAVRQGKLVFHVEKYSFDNQFLPTLAPWLPQRLNEQLENFEVGGKANLFGTAHYNGREWQVEQNEQIVIQFDKLELTYEKFQYKLDDLHGAISIAPQEMQALDGRRFFEEALYIRLESSDKNLLIEGRVYQIMRGTPSGKIDITAEQIAIDDKLMRAIPSTERKILKTLNPSGNFGAKLDIHLPGSVNQNGEISPDIKLYVIPNNCQVCYDKFPLLLQDVRGNIEMENGCWTFRNLYAKSGTSVIHGKGHLLPTANDGYEFRLDLATDQLNKSNWLKLNDELFAAFDNESHRKLLTDLNLSGRAHVELTIQYLTDTRDFHIAFNAVTDPDATKIKPVLFPLLIEGITCNVRFVDGKVVVDDFRGRKSDALLSANMCCMFREDGSWVMNIGNLLAERFEHDYELMSAMPSDLKGFVQKLQIKEPVTLQGMLCFQKDAAEDSPLRSYWNIGVICHQNSAMLGVPLSNICGRVNLLGKDDESGHTVFGKLELDSINYGDYQLTNVKGPFSFHNNEIVLGSRSLLPGFVEHPNIYRQTSLNTSAELAPMISHPAVIQPQTQNFSTVRLEHNPNDLYWLLSLTIVPDRLNDQSIEASVYDGTLWLDGRVFQEPSMRESMKEPSMRYRLEARLREINLERVTRETLAEHSFKGKLSGDIELRGGSSRESMEGGGKLELRDADIYKLPTMQRIMQAVRVRNQGDEQSAICSSDIAFSLYGDLVKLDDIRFGGNVLSLSGTGDITDLENKKNISLTLGTPPTAIAVEGSLKDGNLSVRPAAFPALWQALQTQQDGPQNNRPVLDFIKNAGRNVSKLNPVK